MALEDESDEEFLDDPIMLDDFEQLKFGCYAPSLKKSECSNVTVSVDLTESDSENSQATVKIARKKYYSTGAVAWPVTFFDIPRNVELFNQCNNLCIRLVDCVQHSWYIKKKLKREDSIDKIVTNINKSKYCKTIDRTIDHNVDGKVIGNIMAKDANKSKIRPVDITAYSAKIILGKTLSDTKSKKKPLKVTQIVPKPAQLCTKLEPVINHKKITPSIYTKKSNHLPAKVTQVVAKSSELSRKPETFVDFKKNIGLVGLKITPRELRKHSVGKEHTKNELDSEKRSEICASNMRITEHVVVVKKQQDQLMCTTAVELCNNIKKNVCEGGNNKLITGKNYNCKTSETKIDRSMSETLIDDNNRKEIVSTNVSLQKKKVAKNLHKIVENIKNKNINKRKIKEISQCLTNNVESSKADSDVSKVSSIKHFEGFKIIEPSSIPKKEDAAKKIVKKTKNITKPKSKRVKQKKDLIAEKAVPGSKMNSNNIHKEIGAPSRVSVATKSLAQTKAPTLGKNQFGSFCIDKYASFMKTKNHEVLNEENIQVVSTFFQEKRKDMIAKHNDYTFLRNKINNLITVASPPVKQQSKVKNDNNCLVNEISEQTTTRGYINMPINELESKSSVNGNNTASDNISRSKQISEKRTSVSKKEIQQVVTTENVNLNETNLPNQTERNQKSKNTLEYESNTKSVIQAMSNDNNNNTLKQKGIHCNPAVTNEYLLSHVKPNAISGHNQQQNATAMNTFIYNNGNMSIHNPHQSANTHNITSMQTIYPSCGDIIPSADHKNCSDHSFIPVVSTAIYVSNAATTPFHTSHTTNINHGYPNQNGLTRNGTRSLTWNPAFTESMPVLTGECVQTNVNCSYQNQDVLNRNMENPFHTSATIPYAQQGNQVTTNQQANLSPDTSTHNLTRKHLPKFSNTAMVKGQKVRDVNSILAYNNSLLYGSNTMHVSTKNAPTNKNTPAKVNQQAYSLQNTVARQNLPFINNTTPNPSLVNPAASAPAPSTVQPKATYQKMCLLRNISMISSSQNASIERGLQETYLPNVPLIPQAQTANQQAYTVNNTNNISTIAYNNSPQNTSHQANYPVQMLDPNRINSNYMQNQDGLPIPTIINRMDMNIPNLPLSFQATHKLRAVRSAKVTNPPPPYQPPSHCNGAGSNYVVNSNIPQTYPPVTLQNNSCWLKAYLPAPLSSGISQLKTTPPQLNNNGQLNIQPPPPPPIEGTIIGVNNSGVVRKINITASSVAQNESQNADYSKKNTDIVVTNRAQKEGKSQSNNFQTGVPYDSAKTKSKMLEELNKLILMSSPCPTKKNQKVIPQFTNSETDKLCKQISEEPKKSKIDSAVSLRARNEQNNVKSAINSDGYSPPILPIPTFEKTFEILAEETNVDALDEVKSNSELLKPIANCRLRKETVNNYKKALKSNNIFEEPEIENKPRSGILKKRKLKEEDDTDKSVKKISLNEYKKRVTNNDDGLATHEFKSEIKEENLNTDLDLGYDSDTTMRI